MTEESTPLYDATLAGDPLPVHNPVDSAPTALPGLPPGPDLQALDAHAAGLPDEGHRVIAQHLADTARALTAQIAALTARLP